MSIERLTPPELLSKNKFNVDEEEPHIIIDKAICARCVENPAFMYARRSSTSWTRTGR